MTSAIRQIKTLVKKLSCLGIPNPSTINPQTTPATIKNCINKPETLPIITLEK